MRWLSLTALIIIGLLAWLFLRGEQASRGVAGAPEPAQELAREAPAEPLSEPASEETVEVASREAVAALEVQPEQATPPTPAGAQAALFHGLVLAAEDDRPLAGVEVTVLDQQRARTDAAGRFTLVLPESQGQIAGLNHPERDGGRFLVGEGGTDPQQPLRLRLRRLAAIVGTIEGLGAEPSARVIASFAGYHLTSGGKMLFDLDDIERSAAVAADGTLELANLPSEVPLVVRVYSRGEQVLSFEKEFLLKVAERRKVSWSLTNRAVVRVRVTDPQGNPEVGMALELFRGSEATMGYYVSAQWRAIAEAVTDQTGIALFEQVLPGAWLVGPKRPKRGAPVIPPEQAIASHAVPFEIPEGALNLDVNMTIHRGLWIRGRVLNGLGEAVPNALANAIPLTGHGLLHTVSNAQGGFALGPMLPGSYQVSLTIMDSEGWTEPESIQVEAGTEDLEIYLLPSATIQVRLIDGTTGSPVAGEVTLQSLDGFGFQSQTGGGMLRDFPSIAPGRYHLIGISDQGQVGCLRDVELAAGAAGVPFEIPVYPAGEVRVRYEGPQGHVMIVVMQDGVNYAQDGLRSGTSAVLPVPLGMVTVRFTRRLSKEIGNDYIEHEETGLVSSDAVAEVNYVIPTGE